MTERKKRRFKSEIHRKDDTVDSKEKTAFMETSLFERAVKHIADGAWLYKEVIADVLSFSSLIDAFV